jgi:hypothetical protein
VGASKLWVVLATAKGEIGQASSAGATVQERMLVFVAGMV